tara:strand:- start:55 stop:1071 length:1017 start_codon:yes stop_codon:yes gene_type:complete
MNTNLTTARVEDIILDETHDQYEILGGPESIGLIKYSIFNDVSPVGNTNNLNFAKPLFSSITQYPLLNELVYLVGAPSADYYFDNTIMVYYLPPINIHSHPLHNAFPSTIKKTNNNLTREEIEGGASKSNKNEYEIIYGKYFKEKENIRPLKPYEGDTILEGRYGNSIRFGSTVDNQMVTSPNRWSNEGEIGNPITIIRNGQTENKPGKSYEPILEDIDEDNSSIYLCSNQQLSNFTPSSNHHLSFGANLNDSIFEETSPENNNLTSNVQEDIITNSPQVLIPEELQEDDLSNINPEGISDFDISGTEEEVTIINSNNLTSLPATYDTTGIDINEELK